MTQEVWAARMSRGIVEEVRRRRKALKLSAQQLSELCAKRGLEISRSSLADLETGRRTTLTVAELLVLAKVLGVPPVLLIAPVGHQEMVEVLPGQLVPSDSALEWITGEADLADAGQGLAAVPQSPTSDIALYRAHATAEREWLETRWKVRQLIDQGRRDEAEMYLGSLDQAEAKLRHFRALIRERSLLLPILSPELTYIDAQESSP